MRSCVGGLVTAVLLAACGAEPQIRALPSDGVVVAYGDSLTHGTGAAADAAYPAQLQKLLGRTVINAGVPGEVAAGGRARLPGVLNAHHPALVVLCHGGNDILRRRSMAGLERDLTAMIDAIRDSGADVVLLGVPAANLTLSAPAVYARVAEARAVPLDDTTLPELLADRRMKSDQVHLNANGYTRLAEAVHALIVAAGGLGG